MRYLRLLPLLLLCLQLAACGGPSVASKGKLPKSSAKLRRASRIRPDQFQWPLQGPIRSRYGMRHGRPHLGIDIGGKSGEPIEAAADGEVAFSGKLGGYGNLIVLKHEEGYFTAYGHNKKNLVSVGDKVRRGKVIAKVGRTGNASGDHLHFEIRDQNGSYDPMDFLLATKGKSRPTEESAIATRNPSIQDNSKDEIVEMADIQRPASEKASPAVAKSAELSEIDEETEEDLGSESFFLTSDL